MASAVFLTFAPYRLSRVLSRCVVFGAYLKMALRRKAKPLMLAHLSFKSAMQRSKVLNNKISILWPILAFSLGCTWSLISIRNRFQFPGFFEMLFIVIFFFVTTIAAAAWLWALIYNVAVFGGDDSVGSRRIVSIAVAPLFMLLALPDLWLPIDLGAQVRLMREEASIRTRIAALQQPEGGRRVEVRLGEDVGHSNMLVYDESDSPILSPDPHITAKKVRGHFYIVSESFFP